MRGLLLNGYGFVTVLLPATAMFAAARVRGRGGPRTHVRLYPALILIFVAYVAAVFYFTGPGTLYDLLRRGVELQSERINLVPFSRAVDVQGYALNILLFVPFGILVPLMWPGKQAVPHTVGLGLLFSLSIELLQLLNGRQTDVDDLIMNTLGALIGCLLYKLVARPAKRDEPARGHWRLGPVLYLAVMLAGRCLLYNEMGLARLLYGF